MAATAIAIGGLALSGYGAYKSRQAGKGAARNASAVAGVQNQLNDASFEASKEQAEISRQQEALRREEATNNAVRSRRNIIRQGQVARANAATGAANAGGLQSSSFAGGTAQITASMGSNLTSLNEAFQRGETNFDLNEALADSRDRFNLQASGFNKQLANLGAQGAALQGQSQFGQSLFAMGNAITGNAGQISRVGSTIMNPVFT